MNYAILYKNIQIDNNTSVLIPLKLITGTFQNNYFIELKDPNNKYSCISDNTLKDDLVVYKYYSRGDLKDKYKKLDVEEKDLEEYFYIDSLESIIVVYHNKFQKINIVDTFNKETKIFLNLKNKNWLLLSERILEELENITDLQILKDMLETYKVSMDDFTDRNLAYMEEQNGKQINCIATSEKKSTIVSQSQKEVSLLGLEQYLKSRIIGHDKEIEKIATILCMNYYSDETYGTESILIPGPTGVGKTATFNCASEYFQVPFKNINTCNINPEGIVGTSIEDIFKSLINCCDNDITKAEKAILVFDEFDKIGLNDSTLDIKSTLVNILLKVLEGADFSIQQKNQSTLNFNTRMCSKICLGVFEEAYKKEKSTIGFDNQTQIDESVFDIDLLVSKGYFSHELLSRINHFIPYKELSLEDKKRIILVSKLSEFLKKKQRLLSQFNIKVTGDELFASGVLEVLKDTNQSIRDINNIIATVFLPIERDILINNIKDRQLKLTKNIYKYDIG